MLSAAFSRHRRFFLALWLVLLVTLMVLVILFSGQVPRAFADTPVCGQIAGNTVWSPAGNDYVVTCDVEVANGVTLTIEPGTIVKFDTGTSLNVSGTLVADDCTFTSNQTTPDRGDWGHIQFDTSSNDAVFDSGGNYVGGSKIEGCLVEWGGDGNAIQGQVESSVASPYIHGNTIRNSYTSGIHVVGRSTLQPIVISENSISSNHAISVNGGGIFVSSGTVLSNTVSGNGISAFGHPDDGGGVYATASTLGGNVVTANYAQIRGGGIWASGSTIISNTVSANGIGPSGGGLYLTGSTVMSNTISGNSGSHGGGVRALGISMIFGNTIVDNTATSGRGAGVYADGGTISGNTISGNATNRDGGGVYASEGTVSGNVFSGNSAENGGGVYGWDANISGNQLTDNSASKNGGGIFADSDTTATNNSVSGGSAALGGGIYADGQFGEPNISGNAVQESEAGSGGGIYSFESIIVGNTVISSTAFSDGGGLYADGGTVTGNSASYNSAPSFGHGSGIYLAGAAEFTYNDIIENDAAGGTAGGVSIDGQPASFHFNNLHGNLPYDVEVFSAGNVDGIHNYWGEADCASIGGQLFDGDDLPGRGLLTFSPSLYEPVPMVQLATPANLGIILEDATAALSWEAIAAIPNVGCRQPGPATADVGYRVYYGTADDCTFNGQGLNQGDSPIDAGQALTLDLSGFLPGASYYVVVTAYDYLGRESLFSSQVVISADGERLYVPLILAACTRPLA